MRSRLLVTVSVIALAPFAFAASAHAAPTFSFSGGVLSWVNQPTAPTLIGCVGGNVTNNGTAIAPAVSCAAVTSLSVTSSPSDPAAVNTIDLRGITVAAFPALGPSIIVGNGNDLIYGTPVDDQITGGGSIYGLNGSDYIRVDGKGWGGGGTDTLFGGLGADELNGGYGADILYGDNDGFYEGCPGGDVFVGGPGGDIIHAVATDVSATGGLGDDLIYVEIECAPSVGRLRVDGNEGTDTVRHAVYRTTPFIVRAASGTVYSKATNTSSPQVLYRHQRVETVDINSSARVRIVMQAGVDFTVQADGYFETAIDITVPGGVWTPGDHIVTAPNLGPVTWTDPNNFGPTKVTIHA